MLGAFIAEDLNKRLYIQDMRADIQHSTSLVGSNLQGAISANIALVRGLASTIATHPDISQERFAALSASLFQHTNQLKNIAGAPDLVVSLIYPLEGNEKAIGLDYRRNEAQRKMALNARDTHKILLAGPVNLVQGGKAFIVRYPVYSRDQKEEEHFWGLLSVVVDARKIYQESGLYDYPDIAFALYGKDGSGKEGPIFFGSENVAGADPVSTTIDLGAGSWQLLASPKDGWNTQPDNVWTIRLIAIVAMLMVVAPFSVVGWLFRDRLEHMKELIQRNSQIDSMSRRMDLAIAIAKVGVWEIDVETQEAVWDGRMYEMFGLTPGASTHHSIWEKLIHPDDLPQIVEQYYHTIATGEPCECDFRICLPEGTTRFLRTHGSLFIDQSTGRKILTGVNWDITRDVEKSEQLQLARAESERRNRELEIAKERIENHALHDFLTRLPNRRYLDQKLRELKGSGCTPSNYTCLLKIDLDGFKEINDKYGHAAGDAILLHLANLLRETIVEDEFAARIGGDEFIILCGGSEYAGERARDLADNIIEGLKEPVSYKGRICRLGVSIGITSGLNAKGNPDRFLSNADLALYHSKQSGKGRWTYFTEDLYHKAREERQLAEDIMRAIDNREFIAHFQGQYCAQTHALCGVEALARWNHPERGLVYPDTFLPIAESLGVVGDIDALILDHALRARQNWNERNLDLHRISVNVSARRLSDPTLLASLQSIRSQTDGLTFELVESTFLDRSEPQVTKNIEGFKKMGIDIEIDDFGTAYASIVSLTHLLPHRLKIDRELIFPIIESADQRELVHSIIHIGRTFGVGIIAEGVESLEHADILRIMGAEILQGYHFCKPLSEEEFFEKHKGYACIRAA